MVQIIGPPQTGIAANNQPVNFGPELFKVLMKVRQNVRGVQYLLGVLCTITHCLRDANVHAILQDSIYWSLPTQTALMYPYLQEPPNRLSGMI